MLKSILELLKFFISFFTRPDLVAKIKDLKTEQSEHKKEIVDLKETHRQECESLKQEIHNLHAELGQEVSKARRWHLEDQNLIEHLQELREKENSKCVRVHAENTELKIQRDRMMLLLARHKLPIPTGKSLSIQVRSSEIL